VQVRANRDPCDGLLQEPGTKIISGVCCLNKRGKPALGQSLARLALAICLVAIGRAGLAAEVADATRCDLIAGKEERLKCYDTLAGRGNTNVPDEPFRQLYDSFTPATTDGITAPTALSVRWELEPATQQGVWRVRPYRPLFILPVRYSDNPNNFPQTPTQAALPVSQQLDNSEAEFQLSFKTKGAENLFGSHADLWFAYTQQSQWQVYNSTTSRPFRETDYQPEMFLMIPTRYDLFGLTGRFIDLGLVHQSNGRADPLSRSWNRIYAQFGFERGNFALLARPWYRIKEDYSDDNNPDINRYMGYGDVTAIYKRDGQEFTLLARLNTGTGYGAAEGTWSFPIHVRLKGYVKLFTGYGETMIDYNWRQSSIGVGVLLADWL
jgi:phospholipase A1/A2